MFTGIIEDKGRVLKVEYRGQEKRLTIGLPPHLTEVQLGDSINLNGVCLTVARKGQQSIELDLSRETLQRSALGELKQGDEVNLERALRLNDRLGGHIVNGHIDGVGVIIEKKKERDFLQLTIRIPESVSKYVVQKGSIAIDGISLTVNEYQGGEIRLTLIPYSIEKTTLVDKKVGDRLNVEADILGKYVEKLLARGDKKTGEMDLSFLKEHGFIKGD
ncbi:MAG TPA: riboflavin synthase [Thermodesulfobacteriota bacterium]|nr:riboflavin synthase [Thermodesulfobacteriota bacterium]